MSPLADHREDVLGVAERRDDQRAERLVAQIAPLLARDPAHEVGDVEERRAVDVALRIELERAHELRERVGRGLARDLEPHGGAALATAKLLLDRLEEVLGLFLVDLEVEVARDAEDVDALEPHAREDGPDVPGDEVLEEHERVLRRSPSALSARHLDEAREHHRHLHDAEARLALALAREHHAEVQALVANVRERVARVDRDRRQDREDLVVEALVERGERRRAGARPGLTSTNVPSRASAGRRSLIRPTSAAR